MAGEASDKRNLTFRRDIDGSTRVQREQRDTGSPRWWVVGHPTGDPRGYDQAIGDGGRASMTCEAG
jgi:hypothetical protein